MIPGHSTPRRTLYPLPHLPALLSPYTPPLCACAAQELYAQSEASGWGRRPQSAVPWLRYYSPQQPNPYSKPSYGMPKKPVCLPEDVVEASEAASGQEQDRRDPYAQFRDKSRAPRRVVPGREGASRGEAATEWGEEDGAAELGARTCRRVLAQLIKPRSHDVLEGSQTTLIRVALVVDADHVLNVIPLLTW